MIRETIHSIHYIDYTNLDDLIAELQGAREKFSTVWKNIYTAIDEDYDGGHILRLVGEREETEKDLQKKEREEKLQRQLLYLELKKEFERDA